MKTRLRWFWVALGAFLAIIGEEFLRKLLALSLCGVFLLSYCLPDPKYSASVVAQTPQPAIRQSQTEQKIDNYFSPIQPDGTPKLGIDRWWVTAGVDFENTAVFRWLQTNAARYGFEMSFPRNNSQGLAYQPWHWRFIGDDDSLATFARARNFPRTEISSITEIPEPKPTPSPQQPQTSCQATVNKIMQEISSKGVQRVNFSISKGTANNGMTGNPTNRTDELTVALFNDNPKKADPIIEDIMNSLKLLNSWADQIVKSCNNTATVAFDVKGSIDVIGGHGWEEKFYIQSNNKTKKERCISTNDVTTPFSWGVLRNQPLCDY